MRTDQDLNRGDRDEAIVDRCLRDLPPRAAPATLEARVMAELRRRAARPWWRREVAQWPLAPRAALAAACAGSGVLAWRTGSWLFAGFGVLSGNGGAVVSWVRGAARCLVALHSALSLFSAAMPPAFVWAGLLFAGGLYAVLIGLGALAYRALYLDV